MIPFVSLVVALACVAASIRRLWFVTHATALHPVTLLDAMKPSPKKAGEPVVALDRIRALAAAEPTADWERDLCEALGARDAKVRAALVNEQLTELDWRTQRWARVPRVCASIAASAGFMLAALVMRQGLQSEDFSADLATLMIEGLVGDAFAVVLFGMVGTGFCIATQKLSNALAATRLKAADEIVERLEAEAARSTPEP